MAKKKTPTVGLKSAASVKLLGGAGAHQRSTA
jgi:hypothetical protein